MSMKAWEYVEKGWTRHYDAVDEKGDPVPAISDEAVAWCAYGAVECAYPLGTNRSDKYATTIEALRLHINGAPTTPNNLPITQWNDDPKTSQSDVVAALKHVEGT